MHGLYNTGITVKTPKPPNPKPSTGSDAFFCPVVRAEFGEKIASEVGSEEAFLDEVGPLLLLPFPCCYYYCCRCCYYYYYCYYYYHYYYCYYCFWFGRLYATFPQALKLFC